MAGCRSRIVKVVSEARSNGVWHIIHHPPQRNRDRISAKNVSSSSPRPTTNFTPMENADGSATPWVSLQKLIDEVYETRGLKSIRQLVCLSYDVRRCAKFKASIMADHPDVWPQIREKIGKVSRFYRSVVSMIQFASDQTLKHLQICLARVPSISQRLQVLQNYTVTNMTRNIPEIATTYKGRTDEMQRLLGRWNKYVVHAEMLLLIFYEENPQYIPIINYLGISKRSCFLCANFIRYHNKFGFEGEHKQLCCLWALPKQIKFESAEHNQRFSTALTELHSLIKRRAVIATKTGYRVAPLMKQSVANFSRITLLARATSSQNLGTILETEEVAGSTPPIQPPTIISFVTHHASQKDTDAKSFSQVAGTVTSTTLSESTTIHETSTLLNSAEKATLNIPLPDALPVEVPTPDSVNHKEEETRRRSKEQNNRKHKNRPHKKRKHRLRRKLDPSSPPHVSTKDVKQRKKSQTYYRTLTSHPSSKQGRYGAKLRTRKPKSPLILRWLSVFKECAESTMRALLCIRR